MTGNQCTEWYLNQRELCKGGFAAASHGIEYQKKLTLLCLFRQISKRGDFRMFAEYKECETFDDLFLQNRLSDKEKWNSFMFQIKHKNKENDPIKESDLFNPKYSRGDFYLPKYFNSYLEIKRKIETHSHFNPLYNNILSNLILYTNRPMDKKLINKCHDIKNIEDPFLSGKKLISAKRFNESFLLENFWYFEQCSSHYELARVLASCILNSDKNLPEKFKKYTYPLFTSVFEYSTDDTVRVTVKFINGTMRYKTHYDLENNLNNGRRKFRISFLSCTNGTNNLTLFRDSLLREYFFQKEIIHLKFNLKECHSNEFPKIDEDINNLSDEMSKAIKESRCKEVNFTNIRKYNLKKIIDEKNKFHTEFVKGTASDINIIKFRKKFINKLLDNKEFIASEIIIKSNSLTDIFKELPEDRPITSEIDQKLLNTLLDLIDSGINNNKNIINLNSLHINCLIPTIIVKQNDRLRFSSNFLCIGNVSMPKILQDFKDNFWDKYQFRQEVVHNLEFEHNVMPQFSEEEILTKIPNPPYEEDVIEFGNKLNIYLERPNLKEIEDITKHEFQKLFKCIDTTSHQEQFDSFINKFIIGQGNHMLTKAEAEKLLHEQKGRFYTNISEMEFTNAINYHLKFTPDDCINDFLEDIHEPILSVRSKKPKLGVVRILQSLQKFKNESSNVWCFLTYEIKESLDEYIINNNSKLLLITISNKNFLENKNFWKDIKPKLTSKSKKIIIIIIDENDTMEDIQNISTNFSDLDQEFAKELLNDFNVNFQGSEIIFSKILGDPNVSLNDLDDIITPEVLEGNIFKLDIAPVTKQEVFIDIIWSAENIYFENQNVEKINPLIICGEAGTGKSKLLEKISKSIKHHHPEEWVITIKCTNFNHTHIGMMNFNSIIDCTNLSNRDKALLILCYKKKCKIHLFIDELSETKYWEKIMEIIKKLSDETNLKMYIAMRPHLKQNINERHSWIFSKQQTFDYNNNLNSEEQKIFLKKYWQTINHNIDNTDSERMANNVINLFEMNTGDNTFLGNLLHLKVLADQMKTIDNRTIYNVYQEVINQKLNSVKFEKLDLSQTHIDLALEGMSSSKEQNNRNHTWEILSVGIVSRFLNSNVKFVHKSIAEFFIAECLKQYFEKGKEELKEVFSHVIFMDGYETTLMFLDCWIKEFQNSLHKRSDQIIKNILKPNDDYKLNKIIEQIIFLKEKRFSNLLNFFISKLGRDQMKHLLEKNNHNFNKIVASVNPEIINYQQDCYHRDIEINNLKHIYCFTSNNDFNYDTSNLIFNKHDKLSNLIKNNNLTKIFIVESKYFILSQCRVYQTLIDVYKKKHEYLIHYEKSNLDDTLILFKNCHECKILLMTLNKNIFSLDIEEKLNKILENHENKIIIVITDATKDSMQNIFKVQPFTTKFTDLEKDSQRSFFKNISRKSLEFFPEQFNDNKDYIINEQILQALMENKTITSFNNIRQEEVILDAVIIYLYFSKDFSAKGIERKLLRHVKEMWGKHTLSYVNEFIRKLKPCFPDEKNKISALRDEINLELLLKWKYENIFEFIMDSVDINSIYSLLPNKELLILAIKEKSHNIIKHLINKGFGINEVGNHKMTPLHWASRMGLKGTVQELIKRKAKVELTDDAGFTCLHLAVLYDHKEIVELLLKINAHQYIDNQISLVEYGKSLENKTLLIDNFKQLNR